MPPGVLAGSRFDRCRPQRAIADIFECDSQGSGLSIDRHVTKELKAETRRKIVALLMARGALKDDTRAEGTIKRARRPRPGVDWAGNEFPERLEILERGIVGVEIVCGGVM